MTETYTRDHLKITVVKILQTLGWNSINTSPMEILTDILGSYMSQIAKTTNSYANEFGCTQPNLDHLGLAFRDMDINVSELEEYVKYVNFGPPPSAVPKYPIPKEDHLNFLKPGSHEVVTRPVYIHEHLPPMHPLLGGGKIDDTVIKVEEPKELDADNCQVFKKPADILPADYKRATFRREEEGSRPTREISSVMMTTSGFLSPAREGKLPESRTPIIAAAEPAPAPPPPHEPPPAAPALPKKANKLFSKKVEKRKSKGVSGLNGVVAGARDERKRKIGTAKGQRQQKLHNKQLHNTHAVGEGDAGNIGGVAVASKSSQQNSAKVNKALAAARLKTEKLNTTITPITVNPSNGAHHDNIDKLFSEPDKKKVNIFKKISNVKNEPKLNSVKQEGVKQESRESSPDLIIDEPNDAILKIPNLPSDVTIEPINCTIPSKSPDKIDSFLDGGSPRTPSRPKTPEMLSQSPPQAKEKRKRKEGKRPKKVPKHESPQRLDHDPIDFNMERPKTPEAQGLGHCLNPILNRYPVNFSFPFSGPGLIPQFQANPLFPAINFPKSAFASQLGQQQPQKPIKTEIEPMIVDDFIRKTDSEKSFLNEIDSSDSLSIKSEKRNKEHKKEKKDKIKKRNKKDKIKNKGEKKKLKEEKKEKNKKEKKEKRKEKEIKEADHLKITLKIKSPSPRPDTPETTRKLNIKPIVKKEEEQFALSVGEDRVKRETSPGLAKISALVCGPPKPKPVNPPPPAPPAFNDSYPSPSDNFVAQHLKKLILPISKIRTKEIRREPIFEPAPPTQLPPSKYFDDDGNEVWICPACGRQDDGSPMIGCDGCCDAWYHWVCVGIQVPPDANEDWYCRHCLLKKNEDLQSDKQKKKRKKKEKKEH